MDEESAHLDVPFSLLFPTFHSSVSAFIIIRPSHLVASKLEAIGTGLASWNPPPPPTPADGALDP